MAKKKIKHDDVVRELYALATGKPNDAVSLAFYQELTEADIAKADLKTVAEFRRSNLGSVEIKFIDRIAALRALADILGGEGGQHT